MFWSHLRKCDQCLGFRGRTQETKNNWELEPRAQRMRGGWRGECAEITTGKIPQAPEPISRCLGGERGEAEAKVLQALWGWRVSSKERLGPAWEPVPDTWAWRGSSNVICLLPIASPPPTRWLLEARSSVRSYQEEIPHNRFFVSRGMSSLMENTSCHELRTPESFSLPGNYKSYSPTVLPLRL